MAERSGQNKRKAVTRDLEAKAVIASGDEFDFAQLDSSIHTSDESSAEKDYEGGSDFDTFSATSDDTHAEPIESGTSFGEKISSRGNTGKLEEGFPNESQAGHLENDDKNDHGAKSQRSTTTDLSGMIAAVEQKEEQLEDEETGLKYKIVKDANGNERYLYDEIDPDEDSELDELGPEDNTIGDIPLSFYDHFPHIGYNINGKKIVRPAKGAALDSLLDSMEVPEGWTGLTDPSTGKPLELNQEELQLLKRVQTNKIPDEKYDPYAPNVEYFTSKTEIMPLSAAPEPKRRFVPSKHEAKRVMKIVRAIREGRIMPYKPPSEDAEDDDVPKYDIWAKEEPRSNHITNVPAPKLPPPGFEESYHPPREYLPDQQEKEEWENADAEDRARDYMPTDYGSLRKVPGYDNFIRDKFERCLDLYLAPRIRQSKLHIDPASLLPKLPSPEELRPFPTSCSIIFRGHQGRVRSLSVDPSGLWLASGGDDGVVRVWQIDTGRQVWSLPFGSQDSVNVVRWRPGKEALVLAVAVSDSLHFCVPSICTPEIETTSCKLLDNQSGYLESVSQPQWKRPEEELSELGVLTMVPLGHHAKSLSFHRRGDYVVSVCPAPSAPAASAIAIHTISKHVTQFPFRKRLKGGGSPQVAHFHPSKPILFVANQRNIRVYDLARQSLLKIIQPGARWISSFDIHPTSGVSSGSDNLIAGSYDRRLLWHDLDLSPHPYKTLRYHQKAIRAVKFHPGGRYPLFADSSDDGTVQVFHGEVVSDMMSNARIVPLKVLKGHKVVGALGVLDIDWHPTQPWVLSAGADGTCRLWR